ncbi:hypothetical protein CAPTEDRAFT_187548 [Capitella teleta]|uniref:Glycosyltransferase 61 catalytic domain-containing protein n=1 Tax=Capitella teleta TaxID=283909 RepID=R7UCI9_CAPTE|nr:hypothetical protein CAPTEDRAFT_187548 [Capitella teleta]|eukprot:ELU04095.1 hypothetical protein CAPTEDRAFT_187548 [Capitella teleta]
MPSLEYTIKKFLGLMLVSVLTIIVVSMNSNSNTSYFRNPSNFIGWTTNSAVNGSEETFKDSLFSPHGEDNVLDTTTASVAIVDINGILATSATTINHNLTAETGPTLEERDTFNPTNNEFLESDTNIHEEPLAPTTRTKLSRLFPNAPPDEMLSCIHKRMEPFLDTIIKTRAWVLRHSHQWKAYNDTHNVTVYGDNATYFDEVKKLENIQTYFFNATIEDIRPCLINGGALQYDYGINNCSSVISKAKRYSMYGKSIYDLHCYKNQSMSLNPSPLNDAAFRVGLPENFEHPNNMKTLSYLHIIRDATVTAYGDVTTLTHTLVPQRCFQEKRIPLPANPYELPIHEEVFSMSQYYGKGMFHANIEDISRMAPYIHFLKQFPEIKIHVYDLEFPPVYLSRIDIDPRRFINGTVRAKLMYVPQGINCCLPPLFGTQVESLYLRRNLPNPTDKERNVVVVVKRRNRRGRYFRFHDKILKAIKERAKKYELKIWEFNDSPLPTLNQTAHMFNRAVVIVAPHGAGESNIMFTQPGTILLEGLCIDKHDGLVNVVFRTLSHILGGFYYGFFKQGAHCTETTPEDLIPLLDFYLTRLDEFR